MDEKQNFDDFTEMKDVYSLTGVREALPKSSEEEPFEKNENLQQETSEITETNHENTSIEKSTKSLENIPNTSSVDSAPKHKSLIQQTLKIPQSNKNQKNSTQNSQQKRSQTTIINKPKSKVHSTFEPISFPDPSCDQENGKYESGLKVTDNFVPQIAQNMFLNISDLPPLETTVEQENECNKLIEEFKTQKKLPPFSYQKKLLQYLQRQKVNALVQLKYKEAQDIQETITALSASINQDEITAYQNERIEQLEQKLNESIKKLEDVEYETKELISREKFELRGKRENLEKQHEHELDLFEERWNDEGFLKKFAKPSNELTGLRSIERALVAGRDFAGAEETRLKIEMMELAESEQAQKRAEESMVREQNRLIEKQIKELNAFDELAQRMIGDIEREQEEKKQTITNRIDNLKQAIDVMKNTKKTIVLPPVASTPASAPPELSITPRTSKRYNIYKCIPRNPKITVKPPGKTAAVRRKAQEKKIKAHLAKTFL